MDAAYQMLILLVIVAIGFISRRCNLMGGDFDKRLSAFIIDISCPALILSSVFGESLPDRSLIVPLLGVGFATYGILLLVAMAVARLLGRDDVERGIISFMVMFANVGFLGYPVAASIFGPEAVFYASLLNCPNSLFVFVFGTTFIKGGRATLRSFDWHLLFCPAMIASYISIVIVALGITGLPRVITQPLTIIGGITVPGALLIIGSSMADVDIKGAFRNPRVYLVSAIRLVAVPVFIFFVFKALALVVPISPLVIAINTIIIGMPVASYGTMFCLRYGRDETFMVQCTLLTTVLSAVTIPVLAGICG